MKKITKIIFFVALIFIIIFFCYIYYESAIVNITKPQIGDELIKNGDLVYVEKKIKYAKGDIVLISQCTQDKTLNKLQLPICASALKEQAARVIEGLPGETIDYKKMFPSEFEKFIENPNNSDAFVSSVSIQENQYFVSNPVSKKSLSLSQDVIFAPMIYGKIISIPSRSWDDKLKFLKQRPFNLFSKSSL